VNLCVNFFDFIIEDPHCISFRLSNRMKIDLGRCSALMAEDTLDGSDWCKCPIQERSAKCLSG